MLSEGTGEFRDGAKDIKKCKQGKLNEKKNRKKDFVGKQDRLVSYVYIQKANSQNDGHHLIKDDESPENIEIGRAAENLVLEYEKKMGRKPIKRHHSNPGYDIESYPPNGQDYFIEVKGIDGPWGARGVGLSSTQFDMALKYGNAYWLYVVEHARGSEKHKIYRIQNPANRVTIFSFDHGWRQAAIVENNNDEDVGRTLKYDNKTCIVIAVKGSDKFKQFRVRHEDGSEKDMIFKPSKMELI